MHWDCPYCNRATTITRSNTTTGIVKFNDGNKHDSMLAMKLEVITCPNPSCREYSIAAGLYLWDAMYERFDHQLLAWNLRPQSAAKPFPDFVPEPIRDDYEEACLIRDLSPKASATLSRRCLQGMIRDFWGISRSRLVDEINELRDKVDASTWAAIDAVRSVGNIGAHMEKDINLVIDVDAQEAQLLIGLIEILIKDWYIARHDRSKHLQDIIYLAGAKKPKAASTSEQGTD